MPPLRGSTAAPTAAYDSFVRRPWPYIWSVYRGVIGRAEVARRAAPRSARP